MRTTKFKPLTEDEFKDLTDIGDAWEEYASLASEVNRYAHYQALLENQTPRWVWVVAAISFVLLICFAPWFWKSDNVTDRVDIQPILTAISEKPVSSTDLGPVLEAISMVPSSVQNAEATASKVGLMFTDGFVGQHPDHGKIRFFLGAAEDGIGEFTWIKEE